MRKPYTPQQIKEAVALATVIGSEAAADQIGADPRTVRKWLGKAGRAPELSAPVSGWQALLDLAQARVMSALASGTVRPRDAAVIAGISQRNIRDRPPDGALTEEAIARIRARLGIYCVIAERLTARMDLKPWQLAIELEARYDEPIAEQLALVALQAYHQDHGCSPDDNQQYPGPCPAPLADPFAYLDSLGYLDEWLDKRRVDQHEARLQVREANGQAAEAYSQKHLDQETRDLLAAAEEYLAEQRE